MQKKAPASDWAWQSGTDEKDRALLETQQKERDALREQQSQPGFVPTGFEQWTIETIQRFPADHPQRIRLKQAQMSGKPFDLAAVLRGDEA